MTAPRVHRGKARILFSAWGLAINVDVGDRALTPEEYRKLLDDLEEAIAEGDDYGADVGEVVVRGFDLSFIADIDWDYVISPAFRSRFLRWAVEKRAKKKLGILVLGMGYMEVADADEEQKSATVHLFLHPVGTPGEEDYQPGDASVYAQRFGLRPGASTGRSNVTEFIVPGPRMVRTSARRWTGPIGHNVVTLDWDRPHPAELPRIRARLRKSTTARAWVAERGPDRQHVVFSIGRSKLSLDRLAVRANLSDDPNRLRLDAARVEAGAGPWGGIRREEGVLWDVKFVGTEGALIRREYGFYHRLRVHRRVVTRGKVHKKAQPRGKRWRTTARGRRRRRGSAGSRG